MGCRPTCTKRDCARQRWPGVASMWSAIGGYRRRLRFSARPGAARPEPSEAPGICRRDGSAVGTDAGGSRTQERRFHMDVAQQAARCGSMAAMDDLATASNDPLLRAVLSTAADQVIVVLDPAGGVTVAGSGAERVLGWPAGELLGRHIDTVLLGGGRFRTLVRRDGTEVPVLVSVGALRDEAGTACGAVLVAREIPGDPATDALREANRIKDDFVANVSHELRTPLTMVVGNTEMLLDGDAGELTGPQRRLLGAVDRNARRLHTLVGDLLMLSRIQTGRITLTARPVLLQEIVQQAVRTATEQ